MKPTQTGIAVALAVAVMVLIFIYPSLAIFGGARQSATVGESIQLQTAPEEPSSTTPMPIATELQVTDETIGTGATAAAGDTITVNYVGALTNGQVFDASANRGNEGFTFELGARKVIAGWDQGLVGMKEGGKRRLVIPAELAYGDRSPAPSIPAGSTLVFEVELLKVQKAGQ